MPWTKLFPEATSRQDRRLVRSFVSSGAPNELRKLVQADPSLIGQTKEIWLVADDEVDQFVKGYANREQRRGGPAAERPGTGHARPARGRRPPADAVEHAIS